MNTFKIMTIVGTRPEIIRLSRVIPKLDQACRHVLVHTGQNYDPNLSDVFFAELGLRGGRAMRRGVALRRERLAMTVRLLPAPEALLGVQRQRADDLGERLVRGLRHRVTLAWRHLSEAGGALRPAVLHQRVARERARLPSAKRSRAAA